MDRDTADNVAWIHNSGGEEYRRAAVLPDADLRYSQSYGADIELLANKWPAFPVGIFHEGKLVEVHQLPDPRLDWCREFNKDHEKKSSYPLLAFADESNEAAFLDGDDKGQIVKGGAA